MEGYENWIRKKKEMEADLSNFLGGTKVEIPLTNILTEASKKPIFDKSELSELTKRKWKPLR